MPPAMCKDCHKRIFWSFTSIMKYIVQKKRRTGTMLRAYRCPRHRGWHCTSAELWREEGDT